MTWPSVQPNEMYLNVISLRLKSTVDVSTYWPMGYESDTPVNKTFVVVPRRCQYDNILIKHLWLFQEGVYMIISCEHMMFKQSPYETPEVS